jgi:hypothetical protein
LNISGSSSNGSYRNTDEVWWRYRISRSCDVWLCSVVSNSNNPVVAHSDHSIVVRRLTVDGAVLICFSLLYISISQADSAYYILSQCRLIRYLHPRQIFFKANSSIVAILELIRGAQCLIEVIRSSGEEMWRVDAYQIPYYWGRKADSPEVCRLAPKYVANEIIHWSVLLSITNVLINAKILEESD